MTADHKVRILTQLTIKLGGNYQQRREWFNFPCIYCQIKLGSVGSRVRKLGFSFDRGWVRCLRCNYSAPLVKTLRNMRIDPTGCRTKSRTRDIRKARRQVKPRPELLRGFDKIKKGDAYYRYLIDRGLSTEDILRFGLLCARRGEYAGRVVVPIRENGEVVSFVARAIVQATFKVLTPPGTGTGMLFNLDAVIAGGHVVITEGVFDALVVGPQAVALLGSDIETGIKRIMARRPARITMALDGDDVGYRMMIDAANHLPADARFCVVPPGQDPSDLGRELMTGLVATALDLTQYLHWSALGRPRALM